MRYLTGLLIIVAACSNAETEPDRLSLPAETAPPPSVEATQLVSSTEDLIALLDTSGNVAVTAPDGTAPRRLTEDASGSVLYRQPTWNTDRILAWTRAEAERFFVEIGRMDGSPTERIELPFPPFYYFWSPDGSWLAALGSQNQTLELWLVSGHDGTAQRVAGGEPFYFAWAPDSSELLTHVGATVLAFLDLEGVTRPVSETSFGYQAPQWSTQGQLAFVVPSAPVLEALASLTPLAQQREARALVVSDTDGTTIDVVRRFEGEATFSFSRDGRYLAHSVTESVVREEVGSNFGPLAVTNLDEGSTAEVSPGPVLLFQWSPAAEVLLYVVVEDVEGAASLRWRTWEPTGDRGYAAFDPTPLFAVAYLPFWDQYAQSMQLWAPDGSAYVYTAHQNGTDRVLLQRLDEDVPRSLTDGSVAAWSA